MQKFFTFFYFFIVFCFYSIFQKMDAIAQVNESDSLEVISLYDNIINSDILDDLGWKVLPISEWGGYNNKKAIKLSTDGSRVTGIDLDSLGLVGTIPDINLPELIVFRIEINNFYGGIPNFSGLPKLQVLRLAGNPDLAGLLPDFINCPNLTRIDVENCGLLGTIPDYSSHTSLFGFDASDNPGLVGAIPDFNLPSLIWFDFKNSSLDFIPNFQNLPNLEEIDVSNNKINHSLPRFENCPKLININVHSNEIPSIDTMLIHKENLLCFRIINNPILLDSAFITNLELLSIDGYVEYNCAGFEFNPLDSIPVNYNFDANELKTYGGYHAEIIILGMK